jgi:hypothetical protein
MQHHVAVARKLLEDIFLVPQLKATLSALGKPAKGLKWQLQKSLIALLTSAPEDVLRAVAKVLEAAVVKDGPVPSPQELGEIDQAKTIFQFASQVGAFIIRPRKLTSARVTPPAPFTGGPVMLCQAGQIVYLSMSQVMLLCMPSYELHIRCTDGTTRAHWPCHANLTVNGIPYRVPCRTMATDLAAGAMDRPAVFGLNTGIAPAAIMNAMQAGKPVLFKVELAGYDPRPYHLSVLLCRRLEQADFVAMVPQPPSFAVALQQIRTWAAVDEDEDVQMVDGIPVSLRCPISYALLDDPVRSQHCAHLGAVSLVPFVAASCTRHSFLCTHCNGRAAPPQLVRDPFLAGVVACVRSQAESVRILPCGGWQAQLSGGRWGRVVTPDETEAAYGGALPALSVTEGEGAADDVIFVD